MQVAMLFYSFGEVRSSETATVHIQGWAQRGLHLYLQMLAFKAGEGKQLTIHWAAYSPCTLAVRNQDSGFGYHFFQVAENGHWWLVERLPFVQLWYFYVRD